ncbi:anthranilate phosphoribosyltransferase [Corynebacterium sp. HS2168-gen11]|uniref:anthranilate phosphoribosyltransferase n=1 Tax=Corynebacterium sp. HS2168-gen11 TaxID=2974027 RepID=UPI00216B52F4|nr:anthranilate phosphoribosyltransferase [Corynebacterium sp. HS2168-gen11]MCS4535466.1 anthranilate phosphoribosyltransferase [Corynebacterium sp. HS2168-gen11]
MSAPTTAFQAFLDTPTPTIDQVREVFAPVIIGDYDDAQIAALLATIRTRGETFADIAGIAQAFLKAARPFPIPGTGVLDTAGTGGDRCNTINISTGASLITAAGGCKVIKCGNRSVSSQSGSADVLEALNIPLDLNPERAVRQFEASNFTFLFAPAYHPAVANVAHVRKALGVPTIFNTIGPVLSPVRPDLQLMGVANPKIGQLIAEVFANLGRKRALVIHGSGMDEIALHGPTTIWELDPTGTIEQYTITPSDLGLPEYSLDQLAGGDSHTNATFLRETFAGRGPAAHRDALAASAGAMFYLHQVVPTLRAGVEHALELLETGVVHTWLQRHEEANYGD